jgi:predicted MPP superfamily phosphohydrolase
MPRILQAIHARHGVYGVLGNHDLGNMVAPLTELGVEMLVNRGVRKDIRGDKLWLAGVDDPQGFRCDSLEWALDGAARDEFTLLVAHGPALARPAADTGVDLYLCGHTHGGQVCLPLWGPLLTNAPGSPRAHVAGRWRVGRMHGCTTRGLGTTDLPVRFLCPPEAGIITLRRGASHDDGGPSGT